MQRVSLALSALICLTLITGPQGQLQAALAKELNPYVAADYRQLQQLTKARKPRAQALLALAWWQDKYRFSLSQGDVVQMIRAANQAGDPLGRFMLCWAESTQHIPAESQTIQSHCQQAYSTLRKLSAPDSNEQLALALSLDMGLGTAQNLPQAASLYQKSAQRGNVFSQQIFARLNDMGYGIPENDREARTWYTRAAASGNSKAPYYLGLLLEFGDGGPVDLPLARKQYAESAAKGFALAQHRLGIMYRDGLGGPQDARQAFVWFEKAARQGLKEAQTDVGYLYDTGLGVAADETQAFKWYLMAANQGEPYAQTNLAEMYLAGRSVEPDTAQALQWLRKAAAQNHVAALNRLGFLYADSPEVMPQDLAASFRWYLSSANLGDPEGQYRVAAALHKGRGVSADPEAAIDWYRKAAIQGHASAQYELSDILLDAPTVARQQEGLKWRLETAADASSFDALDLARIYSEGPAALRDPAASISWRIKVCDKDPKPSCSAELGDALRHGHGVSKDAGLARKYLLEAAGQADAFAQNSLAEMLLAGEGGPRDAAAALTWLEKAAAGKNGDAMITLSRLYLAGESVTRDPSLARDWLETAYDAGKTETAYQLGHLLSEGDPQIRDERRAATWFRAALNLRIAQKSLDFGSGIQGDCLKRSPLSEASHLQAASADADTQNQLGLIHYFGRGVRQDYAQSLAYFRKAAAQGHVKAQANLARLLELGFGQARDLDAAMNWYAKAAAQNNLFAIVRLGELALTGAKADPAAAVKWFRLASERADTLAFGARDYQRQSIDCLDREGSERLSADAENGESYAQNRRGEQWLSGFFAADDLFSQSDKRALAWFERAAAQGSSQGRFNLAMMYLLGRGVAQNQSEALKWLQLAAGQGNPDALNNLGQLYELGQAGLTPDPAQAISYYSRAAAQGHAVAQSNLARIDGAQNRP